MCLDVDLIFIFHINLHIITKYLIKPNFKIKIGTTRYDVSLPLSFLRDNIYYCIRSLGETVYVACRAMNIMPRCCWVTCGTTVLYLPIARILAR